jgi:hypothetical protein
LSLEGDGIMIRDGPFKGSSIVFRGKSGMVGTMEKYMGLHKFFLQDGNLKLIIWK